MNNPYEDLEYLAEFLPEEGESVVISRRRGQLVCESYFEPMSGYTPQQSLVDRELYGRLAVVNARLQAQWQTPALITALLFYWLSVASYRLAGLNWSAWQHGLGLAIVMAFACYVYVQWSTRRYFVSQVCPQLQKWMSEHQLDKYTLIAWLTMHRNLSALRRALTYWT